MLLRRALDAVLDLVRIGGIVFGCGVFVDRRPGAPLGFLLTHAPALITLFDMFRLSFLLVRVSRLVSTWHLGSPCSACVVPCRLWEETHAAEVAVRPLDGGSRRECSL